MHGTDRRIRGIFLLVAAALAGAVTLGAIACSGLPDIPSIPTAPIPTFEAPAVEPPKVEPPQAPTLPKTPSLPQGGGNCCVRDPIIGRAKCEGATTCCIKADDSDDCETKDKGFWFFTKEGCAGAC